MRLVSLAAILALCGAARVSRRHPGTVKTTRASRVAAKR